MSYKTPSTLKYTKEHEWTQIEAGVAVIGITDFAQSSLGDIVFVELPEVGRILSMGEAFGVVESVKSVSDLFSPLSGEIIAINNELSSSPEAINSDPYKNWIIKLKLTNISEVSQLLASSEYEKLI
jgi:glycine cleavage system H protein